jgi:hypothetical protein
MDLTSIAATLVAAQAQSFATNAAISAMKTNFGSDKAAAQLLTSSTNGINQAASLAAGVGTNLDLTV